MRKRRSRLVAGCPDATEPAGAPAEGTTEEPMTILHSVAREPVIKCQEAEEFVSQDVVGE